jgi:hypothetical protein
MKRIFILVVIALFSAALFADEATLIDFSKLVADIHVKTGASDEDSAPNQNRATMMDYSNIRIGSSFTEEQKNLMKTSLAFQNWKVALASSSHSPLRDRNSFAQESVSQQWGKIMGIRVCFPKEAWNSWARITPPFDIPAYEPQAEVGDDGAISESEEGGNGITGPSRFEEGLGVVKNVGTIKSVQVTVYGINFPHKLAIILIDNKGNEKLIDMGTLAFDGWGDLRWDNPAYVTEVRNRTLRLYPIYPESTPFVKFGGFQIYRDASQVSQITPSREEADFITYFKDVKLIYDKAVLDTNRDIDDEAMWNIIKDRETANKKFEMERFGQDQVLRFLEKEKQAKETDFAPREEQQQD